MKELSILIPCFNHVCVPLVSALVRQAKSMPGLAFEVVVLDDGSDDADAVEANLAIDGMEHCRYLLMEGMHVAHDALIGNGCIIGNSTKLAGEIVIDDNAILSAGVLMHQFCRVGSYTMVGGGTRFSQNILPYSLVARDPAAFCGLNTVGLRRRGFDRQLIDNIHMTYQILLQSTGKLNDLMERVKNEIPMSPEIQYILDFIKESTRGFIR